MRSKPIALAVAALVGGLISSGAAAQPAGAPASSAEAVVEPLFNAEDLRFLQHMIVHHEQAVVMSLLAPERSDRQEFVRFADYVKRAQAAEIGLMQSLLDLAAERGLELPDDHPHGDPPMAGMLSSAQMDALAEASGAEFERLWLEGMIYHHQGALDMSHVQQRQQLADGRRPYGLGVLVEEIIVEQRAEITKMRAWLDDWGLASEPRRD
ncbi:DUF305 domain-containing protein [Candidatus Rariloculus sp.]|uniref:DUF305 domain-containing protein n=1 Tax=Candidatus Rariloculus sp. TaxID=3101265 RepID=UPI003D0A0A91